jgi:hypothetical protein
MQRGWSANLSYETPTISEDSTFPPKLTQRWRFAQHTLSVPHQTPASDGLCDADAQFTSTESHRTWLWIKWPILQQPWWENGHQFFCF